jgi:hypothetical protein
MTDKPLNDDREHDDEALKRLAKLPRMTHAELVEKLKRERLENSGTSRKARPGEAD